MSSLPLFSNSTHGFYNNFPSVMPKKPMANSYVPGRQRSPAEGKPWRQIALETIGTTTPEADVCQRARVIDLLPTDYVVIVVDEMKVSSDVSVVHGAAEPVLQDPASSRTQTCEDDGVVNGETLGTGTQCARNSSDTASPATLPTSPALEEGISFKPYALVKNTSQLLMIDPRPDNLVLTPRFKVVHQCLGTLSDLFQLKLVSRLSDQDVVVVDARVDARTIPHLTFTMPAEPLCDYWNADRIMVGQVRAGNVVSIDGRPVLITCSQALESGERRIRYQIKGMDLFSLAKKELVCARYLPVFRARGVDASTSFWSVEEIIPGGSRVKLLNSTTDNLLIEVDMPPAGDLKDRLIKMHGKCGAKTTVTMQSAFKIDGITSVEHIGQLVEKRVLQGPIGNYALDVEAILEKKRIRDERAAWRPQPELKKRKMSNAQELPALNGVRGSNRSRREEREVPEVMPMLQHLGLGTSAGLDRFVDGNMQSPFSPSMYAFQGSYTGPSSYAPRPSQPAPPASVFGLMGLPHTGHFGPSTSRYMPEYLWQQPSIRPHGSHDLGDVDGACIHYMDLPRQTNVFPSQFSQAHFSQRQPEQPQVVYNHVESNPWQDNIAQFNPFSQQSVGLATSNENEVRYSQLSPFSQQSVGLAKSNENEVRYSELNPFSQQSVDLATANDNEVRHSQFNTFFQQSVDLATPKASDAGIPDLITEDELVDYSGCQKDSTNSSGGGEDGLRFGDDGEYTISDPNEYDLAGLVAEAWFHPTPFPGSAADEHAGLDQTGSYSSLDRELLLEIGTGNS